MNAILEAWTGLVLLDPGLLLLAALIPLVLIPLRRSRRRTEPAVSFGPLALVRGDLPRSPRMRWLGLPRLLQVAGLLLTVVALARPVERVQLPRESEGIDLLLCIDVSSSMSAKDLHPQQSRLQVAKRAAARFVAGRPDDRFGVVCFARYPDVRCPLTLDHRALGSFLDDLEIVAPDGPEDRTGIGTAVARAAQVLRGSRARSKVVILLTDGEENVATEQTPDEIGPRRAGRLCEGLGIRVYTIAAGLGKRDADGQWQAIDTTQVRELAEQTGGHFFAARDAQAIAGIYARIDELEKVEFEAPRYELRDAFLPFLAGALVLLVAGHVLRSSILGVAP